ncbi:hypothetical protein ACQPX6_13490 [Actinomycetospora sp. CA-101289]|uniref:hypothetical protein n=1 Tax=Actinomycetospora sp. CA-101289 TaxID=3239893 RepID=UPI003D9A075A
MHQPGDVDRDDAQVLVEVGVGERAARPMPTLRQATSTGRPRAATEYEGEGTCLGHRAGLPVRAARHAPDLVDQEVG